MSLNYYLTKCSDDVNTNEKVIAKFGDESLYSLSMACMTCGVPALKTAADCEKLYDRARALEIIPAKAHESWWTFITAMQGFSTNGSVFTDSAFAKILLANMKRDGERERRAFVKKGDA